MPTMMSFLRTGLLVLGSCLLVPTSRAEQEQPWVERMKQVHGKFKGNRGTFAHFGDSITVTMAFWTPLAYDAKNMDAETAAAHALVKQYMHDDCWRKWKGPEFGNTGSMTIRWADENVATWLKKHNPETVLIMFGTNDLGQLGLKEYEEKTRSVVRRCLDNGAVVILTTIPPRSGQLEKSRQFADAVRRIASEEKVPLIDYFDEILKRRPDDWDGSLPKFKEVPGGTYEVPTLLSRDGVHPSNPVKFKDYSDESRSRNGYLLRNYLTVRAYAEVIRHVYRPEPEMLRSAVTFYLSFDKDLKADFAGGSRELSTRYTRPDMKTFDFEKGYPEKAFRVAEGKGISGGALEAVDVLPRNGRIFYPAKGNIAFKKGGWGGSVSLWLKTDPDTLLKTKFCDPVQITQKGANNGGIWCDFNDQKPRDLRMGTFPAVPEGQKPIAESDPKAPMIPAKQIGFKADDWHHLVLSWNNFDTGKKDAHTVLYIDGKKKGELKDIELAMDWDLEKAGIYIAVNYIGLLDEFAVFNRPLTVDEVNRLHEKPALLSGLRN
jgi:lysophospholipase L1-like esterase